MKKYLLIATILFISLSARAQKVDTVVFKHAEKLILSNKLSAAENFKKAGQALIEKGYLIGSKDEQFNQLVSMPYKVSFGQQTFYLVAKDNKVVITSKILKGSVIQLATFAQHENQGKPVAYNKQNIYDVDRFNNMVDLAKTIGYDKLVYSE